MSYTCDTRGPHQSPQTTKNTPKTSVFLCPPNGKICGWDEEMRAQYLHPQHHSGLALSRLGLGGQSQTPATQEDPIRAVKQQAICQHQVFLYPANHQIHVLGLYEKLKAQYLPPPTTLLWSCPT